MERSRLLAAVAAVVVPVTLAFAQIPATPLRPAPSGARMVPDLLPETQQAPAPAQPGAQPGQPAAAGPSPEDQQKKQMRQQKLQQLVFDRRPATILKVWSTAPGEEEATAGQPGGPEGDQPMPGGVIIVNGQVVQNEETPPPPPPAPTPDQPATNEPSTDAAPAAGAVTDPNAKPKPKKPVDPFDAALKQFGRDVTLGNWAGVKSFLASLEADEKKMVWPKLLQGLRQPPPDPRQQNNPMPEQNVFTFADVIALAAAAPIPLDDPALNNLGGLLRLAIDRGNLIEQGQPILLAEAAKPEAERVLSQRQIAKVLLAAGEPIVAGAFLPSLEQAVEKKDHEALNLLARHFQAQHQKEAKVEWLEKSWHALQAIFAAGDIVKEQLATALRQAVDLAPKLKTELGMQWLADSFTRVPDRGRKILASIGIAAAEGTFTHQHDLEFRKKSLELQRTAVATLVQHAPKLAKEWQLQLGLLANNWLKEAQMSQRFDRSTQTGPSMRRDRYGNWYYAMDDDEGGGQMWNPNMGNMNGIRAAEVLELKPDAGWLQTVDPAQLPKFAMVTAQLLLKIQEADKAFPFIEQLATTHPVQAKGLVEEFLRVWTKNHDPNENQSERAYWMYGYEPRAEGIPLTRSKQQRNLEELGQWVQKLRKLPIPPPEQRLLVRAFTTCHSVAEVYQKDAIEAVFGDLKGLKPATLAALAQQMRANLGGLWRKADVQDRAKTKRKQKDIEAEVIRGYQVALQVTQDAIDAHDDNWSLLLVQAMIGHDLVNFGKELGRSTDFSANRQHAFEAFEQAVDLYEKKLPALPREEQTTEAYEHWFYAALGASDLANVTDETVPDQRQIDAIQKRMHALPGELGEWHRGRFANSIFTRMSACKPAVKFRYLKGAFAIIGDHKQAYEAKKVFDYYKDLITEIKLQTVIDGSDVVNTTEPFGVFVNLVHTREIERESGGFARYLQNQNNMSYSYNYGRPTENYREKFTEATRQALGEHFEVLSVTFQAETVNSRTLPEYGWRVTPYAYLLLKPRGKQVDRIAPLRLDLDFLDTSGYVVLPIESPALPMVATGTGDARPCRALEITQILDERQAKDGKLMLEIKAQGQGLVPPFEDLLDLQPTGLAIVSNEGGQLAVSKFHPDTQETLVVSERAWTVTLKAVAGTEVPRKFAFARPKGEVKALFQRYVDADLIEVGAEVDLEQRYGDGTRSWVWIVLVIVLGGLGAGAWFLGRDPQVVHTLRDRYKLPTQMTPFTVLGLLRDIERTGSLDKQAHAELTATIAQLEAGFFGQKAADAPDLTTTAQQWVIRTRRPA
ncbi:MAG: hypothetical protein IPK26_25245 [Planctomycetes bacterium]|nr:hypothetical protein [Planctomycetota bacterium]